MNMGSNSRSRSIFESLPSRLSGLILDLPVLVVVVDCTVVVVVGTKLGIGPSPGFSGGAGYLIRVRQHQQSGSSGTPGRHGGV